MFSDFISWLKMWLKTKGISKVGHVLFTAISCAFFGVPTGWITFSIFVEGAQADVFIEDKQKKHGLNLEMALTLWVQQNLIETIFDIFVWNFLGMRLWMAVSGWF